MFLYLGPDLLGESADYDHRDWSNVTGYRHAIRRTTAYSERDARPQHDDLVVFKRTDRNSEALFQLAEAGETIREVKLDVCKPGRYGQACFLLITLTYAKVTSFVQGEDLVDGRFYVDRLSFSYGRIKWEYRGFLSDGRQGSPRSCEWDQIAQVSDCVNPTGGDSIGYGGGNGATFLTIDGAQGEATYGTRPQLIGLLGFARGLTGTQAIQTTKGTDNASLHVIAVVNSGRLDRDATVYFGCDTFQQDIATCESFESRELKVAEVSYGASQVERVKWIEPTTPWP
jgi:type VI secretion system secreted protein Hcp